MGNTIIEPGNEPIYRLSQNNSGSYLTPNLSTYNSLSSSGWTGDGVDFYADPAGSNAGFPIYKLNNQSTGQYYWTGNWSVIDSLVGSGWTNDGNVFNAIDSIHQETPAPSGLENVYRFYIPQSYTHFYTTSLAERDNMILAGYDYEGVSMLSSANTSDVPVYRLYAPSIMQHMWTTSIDEKNALVASGGWNYEGIAFYVTETPDSSPVYRLYAPSLGTHLWTAYLSEKNALVASGGWNYEGIAWYEP